jgi:hypothetical protein
LVVRCSAPLTVLSSRFLLLPRETDSPGLRRVWTPGALTRLHVRCHDPLMEAAKAPVTGSEAGFTLVFHREE